MPSSICTIFTLAQDSLTIRSSLPLTIAHPHRLRSSWFFSLMRLSSSEEHFKEARLGTICSKCQRGVKIQKLGQLRLRVPLVRRYKLGIRFGNARVSYLTGEPTMLKSTEDADQASMFQSLDAITHGGIDGLICVFLATDGGHLVYLEIGDGISTEVKHAQLEYDISCLDINPIGENPNCSQLAAVGMWTDMC
ncbi:hypothetical protein CsSME_00038009 [Camellia sinensis var. sinensis]